MSDRVGGTIALQLDGEVMQAKGTFSYNLGRGVREAVVGADRVHGYKETPQVGYIEGAVTDSPSLDLDALVTMTGITGTLKLANGKMILLGGGYYAGEGTVTTEEGEIAFRIEGDAEEISA